MYSKKQFIITISVLISCLIGCGGTASDDIVIGQTSEPSLAEVSANLPRPDVPLVVNNGGTTNNQQTNPVVVNPVVENTGSNNGNSSSVSGGNFMRRFLWKPSSERDGNLVVLVDPRGITVDVFGAVSETLRDFGPSNDRGTTARAGRSGCAFGSSILVEFRNSSGQRVGFVNGQNSVRIPDGCNRVEFNL